MLKLFKNFKKQNYIQIIACFALIIFQVWLELKMPDYMSNITALIQSNNAVMKDILKEGAYMLACAFGSLLSAVAVGYLSSTL